MVVYATINELLRGVITLLSGKENSTLVLNVQEHC